MKLKIIYRKNLKMTPGKLAAQAVHAATNIGHTDRKLSVVVLGMSDTKYYETVNNNSVISRVYDAGYTEVDPGTETCAAFYEE